VNTAEIASINWKEQLETTTTQNKKNSVTHVSLAFLYVLLSKIVFPGGSLFEETLGVLVLQPLQG